MLSCFLNSNTGFKLCSFDSCSYLLKKLQHSAILQKVFSFEKPSKTGLFYKIVLSLHFRTAIQKKSMGAFRESNSGPLAPKARIIPLDQMPCCLFAVLENLAA
ncbi:BnaAnng27030D [Brassica napus]|uniref:(rape) hypothetical protein n=1 Tax=Brassica napus TaxID=3708 RepID=A0A078DNT4_BRANA|nr:unnamed protein product [Brassica napus]CDY68355.1 BnaAnng27030D [Brassica napus]